MYNFNVLIVDHRLVPYPIPVSLRIPIQFGLQFNF